MTQYNNSGEQATMPAGVGTRTRTWFRRATVLTALVVAGGVMVAPGATHQSSAQAVVRGAPMRDVATLAPPAGTTWIVGTLTDQAAHGQDNVSVQALPDTGGGAPIATALTYGGPNYNDVAARGFFRIEVPSGASYRIVFSSANGVEDGDPFRMQKYGQGRPILAKASGRAAAAGTVRNLGKIPLVRQGKVDSKIKAKAAKVKVGQRGTVKVTVSSKYVSNVTGPFMIKADGHKIKGRLMARDHGKTTVRLPKFHKPGNEKLVAKFLGTNTVHGSTSKPVKIKVKAKGGKK